MVSNSFNWAIILLVSFIGVAVFGFAGMAMDSDHLSQTCLAANVQSALPCPESGALAFLNFHLNALRSFSLAVLVALAAVSAWLVFSLFYEAVWSGGQDGGNSLAQRTVQLRHRDVPPSFLEKIISWFSLLENSPAVPITR
ncbi:MAG: hypothetical protein AAB566_00580 [Patescibacteria group bacterium]